MTSMKYRARPIVVESVQLKPENLEQIRRFVTPAEFQLLQAGGENTIVTANGVVSANEGDWLLRDSDGVLYPCVDSVFRARYEPGTAEAWRSLRADRAKPVELLWLVIVDGQCQGYVRGDCAAEAEINADALPIVERARRQDLPVYVQREHRA